MCLIIDESREPDSVVSDHTSHYRSDYHTCDNCDDAVPVLGRYSVADDYVE